MLQHRGAVAHGEDRARRRSSRSVSSTAMKPRSSSGRPVVGEPLCGARLGDDEDGVGVQPFAALELDGAAFDRGRLPPFRAGAGRGAGRSPASCAVRAAACPARISSLVASVTWTWAPLADLAQAMVDRQRQLDAARAAADHRDVERAQPGLHALQEGQPVPAELGDRLHRRRPFGGARDGLEVGRRADIDRQKIVGDGRPVLQQHLAAGAIDPGRFSMDQARAGPGAKPRQVDVAFVEL